MADLDISNPLVVIVGFFGIFFTAMTFIVRIAMFGILSPVAGIVGSLLLGGAFFKIFTEKR